MTSLSSAEDAESAKPLPSFDMLPVVREFPDLLKMLDGRTVDSADMWRKERRPELVHLVEHYMYGKPPEVPSNLKFRVTAEDSQYFDGKATRKLITISYGPEATPDLELLLVIPNGKGPHPVFIAPNFCGNHSVLDDPEIPICKHHVISSCEGCEKGRATEAARGTRIHRWRIDNAIDRGYAIATFAAADLHPDRDDKTEGVQPHFFKPGQTAPADHDWATVRAWAWGVSRVVDYLLTDKQIDAERICVTGHSRMGKTALAAAAFDERIALAVPHQSGCGGAAPSRFNRGESVKQLNDKFPHWFNGEFKKFNQDVERLPFDQHAMVALVAPRPLLFSNGAKDAWADPKGQFGVLRAANPVYQLLQAEGIAAEKMPPHGELLDSNVSYYVRDSKHLLDVGYWNIYFDFADQRFAKAKQ